MLEHDEIYNIYTIMKADKSEYNTFLVLESQFGVEKIHDLCKEFEDEDIFIYVEQRLSTIEREVYAYCDYVSFIKQARASYRGQIFKEQNQKEKASQKTL